MDKSGKLILKQGKLVPDAAMGFGFILYIPITILFYIITPNYFLEFGTIFLVLFILAAIFSFKQIVFDSKIKNSFQIRFIILGFLPINKIQHIDAFSHFVIKQTKKSYGIGSVASVHLGKSRDSVSDTYLAIFGRDLKKQETYEICKGTQQQLDQVIKNFIIPNKIPIFVGVAKKGFEYRPK